MEISGSKLVGNRRAVGSIGPVADFSEAENLATIWQH
jgi:hypothetical protein